MVLSPAASWAAWIDPAARAYNAGLKGLAVDRDSSLLECALGFARAQVDLETVAGALFAPADLQQQLQICRRISHWQKGEWRTWAKLDAAIYDQRH